MMYDWRVALVFIATLTVLTIGGRKFAILVPELVYYLAHRFLFHGKPLRKVQALHHQVRTPTHIDALFVYPVETVIGPSLFLFAIPAIAFATGGPLNAYSKAITTLLLTQLNTINYTWVNLPYFPYRTLSYIAGVHAAHHIDMDQG